MSTIIVKKEQYTKMFRFHVLDIEEMTKNRKEYARFYLQYGKKSNDFTLELRLVRKKTKTKDHGVKYKKAVKQELTDTIQQTINNNLKRTKHCDKSFVDAKQFLAVLDYVYSIGFKNLGRNNSVIFKDALAKAEQERAGKNIRRMARKKDEVEATSKLLQIAREQSNSNQKYFVSDFRIDNNVLHTTIKSRKKKHDLTLDIEDNKFIRVDVDGEHSKQNQDKIKDLATSATAGDNNYNERDKINSLIDLINYTLQEGFNNLQQKTILSSEYLHQRNLELLTRNFF